VTCAWTDGHPTDPHETKERHHVSHTTTGQKTHIPPDLVVNRWPHKVRAPHPLISHRYTMGSRKTHHKITATISRGWNFTTKSGGVWNVPQELKASDIPWPIALAEATEHAQVGLEQGEQALRAILVDVPTRVFLLRMIDGLMHIARQRPIAARRVRVEPTPRVHREVRGLLYGLCTVKSLVACIPTAPWRLTQAMMAGRSLS